jgi:hypothetical protein
MHPAQHVKEIMLTFTGLSHSILELPVSSYVFEPLKIFLLEVWRMPRLEEKGDFVLKVSFIV